MCPRLLGCLVTPRPDHALAARAAGIRAYFTLDTIGQIAHQLLGCLDAMHKAGLVHSDVKPDNVCFSSISRRTVRLVDFGSSLGAYDTRSSYVQSRWYRAPEVMLGIEWDNKIDMWSLGCLLCELRLGQPIFYGSSVAAVLAAQQAVLGEHPLNLMTAADPDLRRTCFFGDQLYAVDPSNKPDGCYEVRPQPTSLAALVGTEDAEFLDFVYGLLEYTPSSRMSAAEGLAHPWMASQAKAPGSERRAA